MGHHFVPQAYLRAFQAPDAPGMIWTYPRNGEPRLASIKNVAQASGFYDSDAESDLNTYVEAPANPILDKLCRSETINREERERVAIYVATMVHRVPRHRERGEALIPKAKATTLSRAEEMLRKRAALHGTPAERLQKWLDNVKAAEEKWRVETPAAVIEELRKPWPNELLIRLICSMQWRILVTEAPETFITSDNPAFFCEWLGVAKDDAEFCFPLSPTHCLHCCYQRVNSADPAFITCEREIVREMNRRIASAATSIVMAHRRDFWPTRLLRKKPGLYQINWTS